jgi:hypothetical protein
LLLFAVSGGPYSIVDGMLEGEVDSLAAVPEPEAGCCWPPPSGSSVWRRDAIARAEPPGLVAWLTAASS